MSENAILIEENEDETITTITMNRLSKKNMEFNPCMHV